MKTKKLILWAIDPFEKTIPISRLAVRKLMSWAGSSFYEIQPVHVLRIPEFLPAEMVSEGVGGYLRQVEAAIGEFLRASGFESQLSAKILIEGSTSASEAVRRLCEYAGEKNAQGFVVSSHGRSGLKRMVLGSFAENLLGEAQCPVFFLPQNQQETASTSVPSPVSDQISNEIDHSFRRCLFPTDFSDFSKRAYADCLRRALELDMQVILYYSVCLPTEVLSVGSGAPLVIPDDYFKEHLAFAQAEGAKWVEKAKAQGVRVELVIQDEGYQANVGELVLRTAENSKADLITMASVSGPLKSLVAGSVARDVFRRRTFPVLVYGPKALETLPIRSSVDPL